MDLATAEQLIKGLCAGLPEQVDDKLVDVEILVCETPAEGSRALIADARDAAKEEGATLSNAEIQELTLPADTKGCFIGEPLETEDAEGDDPPEVKYDAEGTIVFCASNIADKDEAVLVFLHEVGHALGLDEDEVKELGLAAAEAKKGPAPNADSHPTNG